ncbi:hypothetical protein [Microbacterium album]|uniref:Uncharacterized protein n=1 Tax=Microbacterium album TaxID=2053191 RepID=A0A917IDU4_9MICO|nr:hypothetical protein [Microbacterium album]GGH42851.1 hypothetical protein GCM10010921_16340 [Microbacterium album]
MAESAVERWARSARPLATPTEVERRVLRESPRARPERRRPTFLDPDLWRGLLVAAVAFSPVFGVAAFLSSPDVTGWWNGLPGDSAVVAAGVCFAVALYPLGEGVVGWLRRGRPRQAAAFLSPGLTLVCAVFALPLMRSVRGTAGWDAWSVPVWAALVLSAVMIVALAALSTSNPAGPPPRRPRKAPRLPVHIPALEEREVRDLLALRGRVLAILAERGHLHPRVVELASDVPLGELHTLDETAAELREQLRGSSE